MPQVVVGLLVGRHGFPLEIGCFEGDKAEKHTILPVIRQFQGRHGLGAMVVVADAGMLSAANLDDLDDAGLGFIVGSRVTKAPVDLESLPLARRRVQRRAGHRHPHPEGRQEQGQQPGLEGRARLGPQGPPEVLAGGLGVFRARGSRGTTGPSPRRRTGPATSSAARSPPARPGSSRTPRGTPALDDKALARARKLAGLKGYVTNLPVSVMSPAEVISRYHDLWHVEQSFRMSKTDLAARPMFVRKRDAIEAHLTIVFTALAVARETQDRTGLAIRNVIRQLRQLRPLRSATIEVNGAVQAFPPAIDPERQKILNDLKNGLDLRH